MHPVIVRHVIYPALEGLLGRRTLTCLAELEAMQWWPAARIRGLQQRKLRRLLVESHERCPYYRDVLSAARVDPFDENAIEGLRRLPLLDKAGIRTNLRRMTNATVPGGPIRFNTGGSTGEPLIFHVDRRRIAYDKAARMLTHAWFGAASGTREVYLWGSPIELRGHDRLKQLRDRITNELLLEAFNLSPESMTRYLSRIEAFDPVSIFGYPSSLARLAAFAEALGEPLRGRNLQAVFVTGELLDDHQRATIGRVFGAPVANCYGSRDGGFVAHECPEGRMHVFDPNVVVEIVGADGEPVACGQPGEIVITHLDAYATPFIRYRTGDVGRLTGEKCPCGRQMKVMEITAGRQTDHLVAVDGSLKHALAAIYVLREIDGVSQFQIRQQADLSIDVFIVASPAFNQDDRMRVSEGIRRQLGSMLEVRVRMVEEISVSPSGKFRHVVSDAIVATGHRSLERENGDRGGAQESRLKQDARSQCASAGREGSGAVSAGAVAASCDE